MPARPQTTVSPPVTGCWKLLAWGKLLRELQLNFYPLVWERASLRTQFLENVILHVEWLFIHPYFSTVMKTSQPALAVKQRRLASPPGCTHVWRHKQFLSLWTHPTCLWAGNMIRGQILNYNCLGEQKLHCWCIRRPRARAMRAPRLMLTDTLRVALRAAKGEEALLLICPPTQFFFCFSLPRQSLDSRQQPGKKKHQLQINK